MKPGKISHTLAVLLSSISSLFAHSAATKEIEPQKLKLTKKSSKSSEDGLINVDSLVFAPRTLRGAEKERYPWKKEIVTTVFWIGEQPSANNPVPNSSSSWDKQWSKSYGGLDDPNRAHRSDYIPAKFTP